MGRYLTLLALAGLAACSNAAAGPGSAQSTADAVTKAIYADDINGVDANFDTPLQSQVTRAQVGALSDKMHAMGNYKGLTYMNDTPAKSEFMYRANFDKGFANVVIREGQNGKLSAYRVVFPQE